MRFDPTFIEKVRESNNLVDIISRYTQLKGSGNRHTGLCPFPNHNEKTPSFSVSEGQQLYHCFGCKKSGNIFHFVQEMQGLSFVESVEYLANKASIDLPVVDNYQPKEFQKQKDKTNKAHKLLERIAEFYQENLLKLPESHPAKVYCKKRNITEEMIKEFNIGFAPDQWDSLHNFLLKIKAPMELAETLGLLKRRKNDKGLYDQYRNRLMFPIITQTENFVGFGGRVLDDSLPKYINSSESLVFKKSNIFYGLNQSAKYVRTKGYVVVVEGYMDFIALYSRGVRNVVATLGTALTPGHAKLISRYSSKLVLLFDGDNAGQTAARKSLKILLEAKLLPKSVVLPNKMDPDDYITEKGAEDFQKQIANSEDLFLIVMKEKLEGYSGAATEKVSIIEELTPIMQSVKHRGLKELYLRELGDRLQVTEKWLLQMFQAQPNEKKQYIKAAEAEIETQVAPVIEEKLLSLAKAPRHEIFLINMALMSREGFDKVIESEILQQISDQNLSKVFNQAAQVYRQRPEDFDKLTALLVNLIDQPSYLSGHLREPLSLMDKAEGARLLEDCIVKIKKQHLQKELMVYKNNLKTSSDPNVELERILNIKKSILEL